ncbi:hypothetical protein KFK09_017613 [Dendrobium nobile]|uniref:Uncharacterized protein n=1 Tax=Dendrobium nobile TaxID=94219 RepID=A0A8T3B2Q2_DENNO|nr:hypothetical protein KFK09_017613 [Dendrobium nobile]
MEEAKAAAYYDELTRKGEGAARFKQGLGFSSSSSSSSGTFSQKPSSSHSSFFSNFVRATSPGKAEKQAQLETIQAKLRRSQRSSSPNFRSSERCRSPERDGCARRRSSSRERQRERDGDCRLRSRARGRSSKSCSEDEVKEREWYRRNRNGMRDGHYSRRGSRSRSPSRISSSRDLTKDHRREERRPRHFRSSEKGDALDFARLIEGYSQMTPAERVRAKMKLQLSQTAAKDSTMGMSSGWERFDFNKDAPLDDNDEIEVAEDDASLVKEIGNSFRFSAVQAKREEQIKAAHDEAMFGASAMEPTLPESETSKGAAENTDHENQDSNLLISDKVLALQQGSWRDRAGRFKS